jgi:hypothetical protein
MHGGTDCIIRQVNGDQTPRAMRIDSRSE